MLYDIWKERRSGIFSEVRVYNAYRLPHRVCRHLLIVSSGSVIIFRNYPCPLKTICFVPVRDYSLHCPSKPNHSGLRSHCLILTLPRMLYCGTHPFAPPSMAFQEGPATGLRDLSNTSASTWLGRGIIRPE